MSFYALLISYPDGSLRIPKELRHSQFERIRWHFPHPDWLAERCANLESRACPVAVVKLGQGHVYNGTAVTVWGREGFLLWEYYGRPYDALTVTVLSHSVVGDELRGLAAPSSLRNRFAATVAGLSTPVRIQWGTTMVEVSLILHLPDILVTMVLNNRWHQLMLRYGWCVRQFRVGHLLQNALANFEGWPPLHWIQNLSQHGLFKRLVPQEPVNALEAGAALLAAEQLREVANQKLDSVPEEEKFQFLQHLSDVLRNLDSLSGVATTNASGDLRQIRKSRSSFSADKLARALSLCMHLRNRNHLRQVIAKSIAFVSNSGLGDDTLQAIMKSEKVPSPSVLSRSQMLLDGAWSWLWREHLMDGSGPLYLWADSSPQAGQDFFLSTLMGLAAADVIPVFRSCQALVRDSELHAEHPLKHRSFDEALSILHKRHSIAMGVWGKFWFHSQIPVALGSGSLEHKASALIHKFRAECSEEQLPGLLQHRIRGLCVDVGVETNLGKLVGFGVADFLQDDSGLCSETYPSSSASMNHTSSCAKYLLPRSLLSSGMCHICHNMTAEVPISGQANCV